MSRDRLTVMYTGRPEMAECLRQIRRYPVRLLGLPLMGPVDLAISAAGSHIFTTDEIALAHRGVVNLHLAPLPGYRGRYSATHAILNGEREYGVTLHYIVDEGIDTGPIIAEQRFPITDEDTAGTLRARARAAGERLFTAVLPRLLAAANEGRRLPSVPQDESQARYYDRHSLPKLHGDDPVLRRALTL